MMGFESRLLRSQMLVGVPLTAFLILVSGCGGSSDAGATGGGGGGSTNDALKIDVPDTVIDYGDHVTITWTGKDLQYMDTDRTSGSNFEIDRAHTSGSVVDRPAADTTYKLVGVTKDEGFARATVTVRVRPSTKSFLVVGSKGDKLVPQAIKELRDITTGVVSWGQKIPSTPVADVLVLLDSGSFDKNEEPKVRALLQQGARLLLVNRTIRKLAGAESPDDHDLSSVESWFGANYVSTIYGGCDILNTATDLPLSLVQIGRNSGGGPEGTTIVMNLDPGATVIWQDEVKRTSAFVRLPALGGRLAHMGALSFGPSDAHAIMKAVFLAECRWLADYN